MMFFDSSITLIHYDWYQDVKIEHLRLMNQEVWGCDATFVNYGDINEFDRYGARTGKIDAYELALKAQFFYDGFGIGLKSDVKYLDYDYYHKLTPCFYFYKQYENISFGVAKEEDWRVGLRHKWIITNKFEISRYFKHAINYKGIEIGYQVDDRFRWYIGATFDIGVEISIYRIEDIEPLSVVLLRFR